MTTTHDAVHHPSHYTSHPSGFECLEVTRQLSFDTGNAVKYVWRRNDKGTTAQDLDKALFYLGDAVRNAPESLAVPKLAAEILRRVADADPDPRAGEFFRAAGRGDWHQARAAAQKLRDELQV